MEVPLYHNKPTSRFQNPANCSFVFLVDILYCTETRALRFHLPLLSGGPSGRLVTIKLCNVCQ